MHPMRRLIPLSMFALLFAGCSGETNSGQSAAEGDSPMLDMGAQPSTEVVFDPVTGQTAIVPTDPANPGVANPTMPQPSGVDPTGTTPVASMDPLTPAPTASVTPPPVVPPTDPGRVTLHRLNRAEYNNTVQELLHTTQTPADSFPPDDSGAGFDNMADVLALSPTLLASYQAAAVSLADDALTDPAQRAELLPCDLAAEGRACAATALSAFLPRAFRRPVSSEETAALLSLVDLAIAEGDSAEVGFSLALQAALVSPHFLFRVELDPEPTSLTPHPLNGYEIASRLSYFLWSSMPDDALFASAAAGALSDPVLLSAEVDRMLASPKAEALVSNFAAQWLQLRRLEDKTPDAQQFPDFDAELRASMRTESEMLFREIALAGAPATDLLQANYTFVDARLAAHYGLPAPSGEGFVRTPLEGNAERRGFLSHGSFLTVTSHPRRTSPVLRGKWVMDELMCTVIPPPPMMDETSEAIADFQEAVEEGASQRERLEAHLLNPTCATCHSLMDPIGFGLENYDAVGVFRSEDNGAAIDASGTLPSGSAFSGVFELVDLLAADPNLARCMTQKLFTYALGRTPSLAATHYDPSTLLALADGFRGGGYSFRELVRGIVLSVPFSQRRGDDSVEAAQ
jgi:hypothetical protein